MPVTAIANVLAAIVVVNVLLTLTLLRRLGPLQKMVEESGGLPNPALPGPGTRIGAFRALTVGPTGGAVLSEECLQNGSVLVGFFLDGCPQCEDVRAELL